MAWIEAGLSSSVTVAQILNGKHHNRVLDAHQISLQVLFDLWIEALFENKTPALYQACRNGLNVAEARQQMVSLVNTLELKRIYKVGGV